MSIADRLKKGDNHKITALDFNAEFDYIYACLSLLAKPKSTQSRNSTEQDEDGGGFGDIWGVMPEDGFAPTRYGIVGIT